MPLVILASDTSLDLIHSDIATRREGHDLKRGKEEKNHSTRSRNLFAPQMTFDLAAESVARGGRTRAG